MSYKHSSQSQGRTDGLKEFGTCGSSSRGDTCKVRTEVLGEVRYGHFFLRKRACRMSTLQKLNKTQRAGAWVHTPPKTQTFRFQPFLPNLPLPCSPLVNFLRWGVMSIIGRFRLIVPGATAKAAPKLGQALGPLGINMVTFCKDFNARTTKVRPEVPIQATLVPRTDRTYKFFIRSPMAPWFLLRVARLPKGSDWGNGAPPVGNITLKELYHVAKAKSMDPQFIGIPTRTICLSLMRTAKQMGIKITKDLQPEFAKRNDEPVEGLEERRKQLRLLNKASKKGKKKWGRSEVVEMWPRCHSFIDSLMWVQFPICSTGQELLLQRAPSISRALMNLSGYCDVMRKSTVHLPAKKGVGLVHGTKKNHVIHVAACFRVAKACVSCYENRWVGSD